MGDAAIVAEEECTLREDSPKERKRQVFQEALTFHPHGQLHLRKLRQVALSTDDQQVTDARVLKDFLLHREPASKGPILSLASTARMDGHERLTTSREHAFSHGEIFARRKDLCRRISQLQAKTLQWLSKLEGCMPALGDLRRGTN